MRDYLVTQNLFQWYLYDNKCTCRHLNHQVMLITSGDIAVSTFWRPSWTPSWIMEKAPAGITGNFSMLFLMVFGRYPEKFSLGIFCPLQPVSIVGSLRDREVACSASDRQGSNFESCVWRTVSSQSSHHPQEVLLAQLSLYVHKGGLKPDSFHFHFLQPVYRSNTIRL